VTPTLVTPLDIEAIEKVQRRFTKRVSLGLPGLHALSYARLELRRLHTDLIWCYKIVFGIVHVGCDNFFKLCASSVTVAILTNYINLAVPTPLGAAFRCMPCNQCME